MKRERKPKETRNKIIAATHRILREGGYFMNFSLDKVAQAARVSKGGLMHHFQSKDALLRAAAQDTIEQFESQLADEMIVDDDAQGRMTRAYVKVALDSERPVLHEASPLVLSYLNDKEGIERPNRFETWQTQTEQDGLDVVLATIIRFAVDGILYTELIDNQPIPAELKTEILERLRVMIAEASVSSETKERVA
ncbi:MAG: TetR/AcrR family transcriptional regulator [Chloroflexota bacterium]